MTGSPSTQKSYTYRLSGYGPAEEVWEVAQELALQDEAFAAKVSGKSVGGPASALPRDHVLEMVGTVEEGCSEQDRRADGCAL